MSHIEVRLNGIKYVRVGQTEKGLPSLKDAEVARTTQYVNQTEVPPLCPGWQIEARKCVDSLLAGRLSNQECHCVQYALLRHLELVITSYVHERLLRTSPITWDNLISDLEAFAAASAPFLDKSNNLSAINPIWRRIQEQDPHASLANTREVIAKLSEATHAALKHAEAEKAAGKGRTYTGPWVDLINRLADLFEAIGLRPTAAKTSNAADPRPSNFVAFVRTVMTMAVPELLREHVSGTQSTMAGEINEVLAKRQSGLKACGGHFTIQPTE
jgi:hypothetical protein